MHNFFRLHHTAYMKKILFLITSALAAVTACFAVGCNVNQDNPEKERERNYQIKQQGGEDESPEEDKNCRDGDCENRNLQESIPEFKFRPHRPRVPRDKYRERENDGDNNGNEDPVPENIEPIRPHKKRPHKNNPDPAPMPAPLKPRK